MLMFNNFPPTEPGDVEFSASSKVLIESQFERADDHMDSVREARTRMAQLGASVSGLLIANGLGSEQAARITDNLAFDVPTDHSLRMHFHLGVIEGVDVELEAQQELSQMTTGQGVTA
jgi:hypothetical protein